jgi:hypothetical protein
MRGRETSRDAVADDREAVAAELRTRVATFDQATQLPPGLLGRVTAPADRYPGRPVVAPRRRWSTVVLSAVAVTALVVGLVVGVGWQRLSRPALPTAGSNDVEMVVNNAEKPCQSLRTIECGLTVRRDPYKTTPAPPVARVWHGDRVVTDCVVVDGKRVSDEDGVSSNRWYKIRTRDGAVGFLPAVRTRNTVEVAICPPSEVPPH